MYFCQTCVDQVCITDLTIQYDVFLPDVCVDQVCITDLTIQCYVFLQDMCGPGQYYGSNHSI